MTDLIEDAPLSEEQLEGEVLTEAAAPVGRIEVPKRGKLIAEDGSMGVSIIRPCVSRGRRLGPAKLPPIYTPRMLAENASVFTGWLMYMDHLTEGLVEMLQERGRSITELGGRVLKSWYDPELVFEDDEEYGFVKGGVRGRVIPQPAIRAMLEADPGLLHVSINAWPTGARPGVAPWNSALKGMLVEGIRGKPPGSVDWVPRAGAGGRPLLEWEETAVSLLESYYAAPRGRNNDMPEWKTMTRDQLVESLRSENPGLAADLGLAESAAPPKDPPATGGITEAQLKAALAEQQAAFEAKLAEKDALYESLADDVVSSRDQARALQEHAKQMIETSGLSEGWQADLKRRYSVGPDGPSTALAFVLEEEDDLIETLEEAVKADLEHARKLIEEATGRKAPRVSGLGGASALAESEGGGGKAAKPKRNAFREFLRESGDKFGDKPEDFESGLREMVQEGVA